MPIVQPSTHQQEFTMTSRITYKATALALAAMVTISVLAGLNAVAASETAAAQTQLAQTTAERAA
jgi:hypothetical protein